MFAVVVLLTKPREHCVIPEKYIFGIEQIEAEMKTWGVNKAHDHLIYWSRSLDNDFNPQALLDEPNFNLMQIETYPPPMEINSACYLGRIKRFFSK